jgi:hypothetical protein
MYTYFETNVSTAAVIKAYMGDQVEKNYQFQVPVTLLREIRAYHTSDSNWVSN